MEAFLYLILLIYFAIGAVLIHFSNKKKDTASAKKNWIKYFVYLIILNILFASILLGKPYFTYLCGLIVLMACYEIIINGLRQEKTKLGLLSLLLFSPLAALFFLFSFQEKSYLFYSLYLVTVFDAFSQLSGQLFGKTKITRISPNKTYEGLLGGSLIAIVTSLLIRGLLDIHYLTALFLGLFIIFFAFFGDLLASLLKRKFGIKDYSQILPGQGGFLDRFDSLIAANALLFLLLQIT